MAEDLAHSETNTIRKFIDVMLKENSSKEMDLLRIVDTCLKCFLLEKWIFEEDGRASK